MSYYNEDDEKWNERGFVFTVNYQGIQFKADVRITSPPVTREKEKCEHCGVEKFVEKSSAFLDELKPSKQGQGENLIKELEWPIKNKLADLPLTGKPLCVYCIGQFDDQIKDAISNI